MRLFFSCLLLSMLCISAVAQSNFKPGYIVNLNGDTTKGFIDYKQWGHRNPTNFTFKDGKGEEQIHSVANVNAFGVNDYESYRASTVSISQSSLKLGELVNYVDTTAVKQKVFLRMLVAGEKVSLFVYEDELKNRLYVTEGRAAPVELLRYRHISPTDNNKIVNVDTYREQLQRLAATYQSGNAQLSKQIQEVFYDEDDLKNIILKINGVTAVKYVEEKRSSLRFYVGAGVYGPSIRFTGGPFEPGGARSSYIPQLALGFDVLSNKNVAKLMLRLELTASAGRTMFKANPTVNATTFNYEYALSRLTIGLTPQLLYNFYNTNNFKIFAAVGGGVFFTATSTPVNKATYTQSGKTTEYIPISESYNNINFMPVGKLGFTVNRVQFYGGYSPAINIRAIDNKDYQVRLTSYSAGINYLFGK